MERRRPRPDVASRRVEAVCRGYDAFNRRDLGGALQLLDPMVEWPDMIEGRTVVGREAVRGYWTRLLELADSHVEPGVVVEAGRHVVALVDQRVRERGSDAGTEQRIAHLWTFRAGLATRMEVLDEREHPGAELVRRFHELQGRFYAGGKVEPLLAMLDREVEWHVPGESPIAGHYRGLDEVLAYFETRRERTTRTMAIEVRDVLAGGRWAAILADGTAELRGRRASWGTVGLFRVEADAIRAGWLIPLDRKAFDAIWS